MNSQWEDWAECYILKEFTERQYNAHGKAGVSVMTSYDVVLTNGADNGIVPKYQMTLTHHRFAL